MKSLNEHREMLKESYDFQIGDKVTYYMTKGGTKIPFKGEVIEISKDFRYLHIRNSIGNIDFVESSKVSPVNEMVNLIGIGAQINKKAIEKMSLEIEKLAKKLEELKPKGGNQREIEKIENEIEDLELAIIEISK